MSEFLPNMSGGDRVVFLTLDTKTGRKRVEGKGREGMEEEREGTQCQSWGHILIIPVLEGRGTMYSRPAWAM